MINNGSVTFNYYAPDLQDTVFVRGGFNEWGTTLPMTKDSKGVWSVTVSELEPGNYEYKFYYDDGSQWGNWFTDPLNDQYSNGNSLLVVPAPDEQVVSKTKVIIHYQEAPGNTKDWNLWVWPENGQGKVYP